MTDPAGQFDWLEGTLLNATKSLEKVGGVHSACRVSFFFLTFDLQPVTPGVHHWSRASGIPALRQEHHRCERAPQREAGLHLQALQRRHRGALLRPHPPRQHHGAAGPARWGICACVCLLCAGLHFVFYCICEIKMPKVSLVESVKFVSVFQIVSVLQMWGGF